MSALSLLTDKFVSELNKFCYSEGMVPLICVTIDKLGMHGLFCHTKYTHQQKAQILNTGLNVAIREYSGKNTSILQIQPGTIDYAKQNADTDEFLNECLKFCYASKMMPVITVTGQSTGKCLIFDNGKLTAEQKLDAIFEGMKALKKGINRDLSGMKQAKYLDLEKGKIFEN